MQKIKAVLLPFLSLFTSLSTVLCCALPIMLVTLGMGATFASLTASFPQITWLAQRSGVIFVMAGALLLVSGYFIFVRAQVCPSDPDLGKACASAKRLNKWVWWASTAILLVSAFFKYVLILLIR